MTHDEVQKFIAEVTEKLAITQKAIENAQELLAQYSSALGVLKGELDRLIELKRPE